MSHAPSPQQVWSAIDLYMAIAYEGAAAPAAVQTRLEGLRAMAAGALYDAPAFERDAAAPARRKLRLGNRFYPHMKLVIDHSPDGEHCFFRADTHDQHARPDPNSREYEALGRLVEANQQLAQRIEAAWELRGLPTFKAYLREDLVRRQAGGTKPTDGG